MNIEKNAERDIIALGLFKEYTLLELKTCVAGGQETFSERDLECMERAIEYYRVYNKLKIEESKLDNGEATRGL